MGQHNAFAILWMDSKSSIGTFESPFKIIPHITQVLPRLQIAKGVPYV